MKKHFYAIFNNYRPNSAPTNRMLSYLEAWSKERIDVTLTFMLPDRSFSKFLNDYPNIKVWNIWEIIPIRNYVVHYFFYTLYIYKLSRRLKAGDVVFVYGQIFLLKWLSKLNGVKVYHERNEHPLAVSTGKWPYKVSLSRYLRCCRRIDGLFVISTGLKDYYSSQGVDAAKINIVNMTVDAQRFVGITKAKDRKKYIAYCGNASNNKDGVDQLIKAFALISPKYSDLYLYIIGQAPSSQEINSNGLLAKELGVETKVCFTGIIPYTEMPQILTDATILALDRPDSLQAKHGFPTKLGEYLLTGNPVVVTSVGDIPLFMEDGVSGMVAEPGNPKEFASKLEWLLEHPKEACEIGRRGKQVALDNFNNRIEAKKITDAIFQQ